MLILTRRIAERMMIGDDIEITVLGIKGNQVRLGIHAPDNVEVHREEIYRRIREEKNKNRGSLLPKPERQTIVRARRF